MIKHSLIPKVLHERTGRSAFNLGLIGGPAPASYFLFCCALMRGRGHRWSSSSSPASCSSSKPESKTRALPWADLLNLREALEFSLAALSFDLFAGISLARLLPSFKNRDGARAFILARLRGENPNWDFAALQIRRNCNANLGAMDDVKASFQDFPAPTVVHTRWFPGDPPRQTCTSSTASSSWRRSAGSSVCGLPAASPGTQRIWDASGEERLFESFGARCSGNTPPRSSWTPGTPAMRPPSSTMPPTSTAREPGAERLRGGPAAWRRPRPHPNLALITLPAYRSATSTAPGKTSGSRACPSSRSSKCGQSAAVNALRLRNLCRLSASSRPRSKGSPARATAR